MQVSGQVSAINARTTKFGDMYDVVVNGKKYGAGKYAPRGIQQGDFVTFEVDVKQNGQYTNYNIRTGTMRKDDGNTAGSSPAPSAPVRSTGSQAGGFDNRQETISKQAALNTALTFVNLAASQGAIPHLAKAKESDKLGLVQAVVLEYAATFYNLSTGNTWDLPTVETVAVANPKAKPKAKPEPEAVADDDNGYDEY